MKKELACVWRLAAGDERTQSSRVLHICRRACGKLGRGDQPVPAQTVGASRDDLRLAERRGQESLPFPVLPGYRPMHCLEGLLSGGRTANRTRVYIHALASPAARAFRVPGRLEPGCGFDPNLSGDRRPRRTDQALRLCCTSPPKEGAVNNADYRGGVTCLQDTQLLGACLHASESGGRSRPQAVRGIPDVPIAPPATGPPEGWAAVGSCQPSLFQQGVVGAFAEGFGVGKSQDLGCCRF